MNEAAAPGVTELNIDEQTEWLETDGLGGFASGTTSGIATRRYHALLLSAAQPPTDRWVLVNGFVAWLETPQGRVQLTRHHYAPGVTTAADASITRFDAEPWPTTLYETSTGLCVSQEIVMRRGSPLVELRFGLLSQHAGVRLCLRPLLSGRDFHQLQRENTDFRCEPEVNGRLLTWSAYPGVPSVRSVSNGTYRHAPEWYRRFRYQQEVERQLDCDEDLAAPGVLEFDLSSGEALWQLSAATPGAPSLTTDSAGTRLGAVFASELERRQTFTSPLERAADAYLVERGGGTTLIAGYPWFGDWGRDTFIALRGLCLSSGRFEAARRILLEWANVVSDGMLPNRFPDLREAATEYNSVDASLWYVIAAHELLLRPEAQDCVSSADRSALQAAMAEIVGGYARGTRYGIARDEDGLLRAGVPGSQLTWMDAKIGDYVVTPRAGKPVEIQALWINALFAVSTLSEQFRDWFRVALDNFEPRFWNAQRQALFDVVDVEGRVGEVDASLRPNQIFAAGGLPFTPLSPERARSVVDKVEDTLWTPLGLRSLASNEAGYRPHYAGGVWQRDTAYHQGTVWPWLLGPFVEAWVKARGSTAAVKHEARARFLAPVFSHLRKAGIGHVSEITDAEAPYTPRGCPFQAWSLGELMRLHLDILR